MAKLPASVAAFLAGKRFAVAVVLALACCGDATARASSDGLPSPGNSTIPRDILLVGRGPVAPDTASGGFEIVVRDLANNPIGYATVILDFATAEDFRFASDQMDPALHVRCDQHTIYRIADAAGVARFTIVGGGRYPPHFPGSTNVVGIAIDGAPFATTRCRSFDMNGADGVTLLDFQIWVGDFFGDLHPTRSDFNADGKVTLLDVSLWARAFFDGASTYSAPAYCP